MARHEYDGGVRYRPLNDCLLGSRRVLSRVLVLLGDSGDGVFSILVYGVFGFGIERFRASKAMTAAQYHEMRYSRGVRVLVGIVMGVGGVLNMALFPTIGANFLSYYLGLPESFLLLGTQIPTVPFMVALLLFWRSSLRSWADKSQSC